MDSTNTPTPPFSPTAPPETPLTVPLIPTAKPFPKFLIIVALSILLIVSLLMTTYILKIKKNPTISPPPTLITSQLTETDTNNWKIYTYSNYGFSIQLPESWKIIDDTGKKNIDYPYIYSNSPEDTERSIIIRPISKQKETIDHLIGSQGFLKDKGVKEMIGSYDALSFTHSVTFQRKSQPTFYKAYFLENDSRVFLIFQVTSTKYVNVLDQILSTFKFLGRTNDISNWKTYKSERYNYQFEYPQSWDVSEIGEYGMGDGGYGDLLLKAPYTQETKTNSMTPEKDYVFLEFNPDFPKTGGIPTTNSNIKVTKTNTIIAGKNAIIYTIEVVSISEVPSMFFGPIGHKFIHIYIDREDSFFMVRYDGENNSEIVNQILTTLKFKD